MLWLSAALAGTLVGLAGTGDVATGQGLIGAEVSVLGDQTKGFRPHGRLLVGLDPFDILPTATTELGFTGVAPSENVTIRAGMFARVDHLLRRNLVAIQVGSPDPGQVRYGVALGAAALAELAWTPDAPLVLGGHLGFGHWSAVRPSCLTGEDVPNELDDNCRAWPVSILGGIHLRKSLKNGLTFRANVGTTFEVGVGYRFKTKRPAVP